MSRQVDPALKAKRDAAVQTIALARNYVALMRDKTRELHSATAGEVSGHWLGDQLAADLERAVDALTRAGSDLSAAGDAARSIDVTVEVPDWEEPDHGW
jgi:hypothetical protein